MLPPRPAQDTLLGEPVGGCGRVGELWSGIKRLGPGQGRLCLALTEPQFTSWAGAWASRGQYFGRYGQHCFSSPGSPGTLRPRAQTGAATELLPSASAPSSAPTLELMIASLNNMSNNPVRKFHSFSPIPQRQPREFEQLSQGCTAVTPHRPGPNSFLMEDPGLQPGLFALRAHCAQPPRPQFHP